MRLLLLLAVASAFVSAQASPASYVLNTNTTIEKVDVPTNTDSPFSTTPFQSDSLAISPSGILYSADPAGVLWNVTGAPQPVGPTGFAQVGDLDYAPNGLWGFSNATQTLFFFDLGSLSVTSTATFSALSSLTVTGVAHQASSGSIFLSARNGLNNDFLYQVPSSLSTVNLIGATSIGDSSSYISDIDFDASGNLLAMTWFHRYYYTVSTTTAATSLISAGPHRDTTGMALEPVPEPAGYVVLVAGIAALARRCRRPRV